ncbi:DNA polymerase alpha subunit B isoform X4 [Nerophis ophidion]|uniref:DNA polymerase alpha subunit B isoform X4 n=1 Tax=Nerophis ophidion TaxID=159077 RepID=UPI002AE05227|nr:DNA polymerase alpha subunit B isoform X4 [Nerophis ophidion]
MPPVTAEDLKTELEMFCITCEDDSNLDKMVEQCVCNRMPADQWVLEWVAYSTTKNGLVLSVDSLDQFEHDVLNKRTASKQSLKREEPNRPRDIHTIHDIIKAEEEEDDLLDCYSTPAKGSQKRALTTPENPHSKRTSALLSSPSVLLSPSCFSPSSTPSQKYSQRGGKGEVVVSFGAVQGTHWAGRKSAGASIQPKVLEGPEHSLHCSYKYMFQRLRDVRNVLTEKIEELGEELRSHFSIEEFSPVSLPAQVVAMEGMNTTGDKLVVSKIYEGIPPPFFTSDVKEETDEAAEALNVLVACGPYTPSDSLNFDPLLDLIHVIARDRPDVCILLGPFVDSKHEQVEKSQVTETYDAIFSRCINSIVEGTKAVGCSLVFVPSQRDVHHHYIYPQPPFTLPSLSKNPRVTLVPDPCTLLIDNVTFGVTSTDILFHMGSEEISCGTGSDRFSRIVKHMLTQRSYYPLYPPAEELNMDYEKFQSFGLMPLTPDVLVIPSEMRYFVKDVLGCVCINPGRLTKGQVGGTYGRLMVKRTSASADKKRVSPCLAAQVVKV